MKHIQTFDGFLNEADKKPKEGEGKKSAPPESVEVPKEGTITKMDINGEEYTAVLTTYKALGSKQASMGQSVVGMISLPGEDAVWELFDKSTVKQK